MARSFRQLSLIAGLLIIAGVGGTTRAWGQACNCEGGDDAYTVIGDVVGGTPVAITVDGTMTDWAPVLTDPDNNTCDGAYEGGSAFDPTATVDPWPDYDAYDDGTSYSGRDAYLAHNPPAIDNWDKIQSTGRDLAHFAYTWDDTYIYAYTSRVASDTNTDNFIYYADANNDGFMQAGEPVIVVQWQGSNRTVTVYIGSFKAGNAPAAMTDASGSADGWPIAGDLTVGTGSSYYAQGTYGSADGTGMEWRVAWNDLFGDTAGPRPFKFHISSTNSQPNSSGLVDQIDDNMGGCGGGGGSFPGPDVTFTPDRSLMSQPNTLVPATHTLQNTGTDADTFSLVVTGIDGVDPSTELTVTIHHDTNTNGQYDPGVDLAITDTDVDGIPDSGLLAVDEAITLFIVYSLPDADHIAAPIIVTTQATSTTYGTEFDTVVDTISFHPDLVVTKQSQVRSDPVNGTTTPKAIPGSIVRYTITLTNTGLGLADADSLIITDPIPTHTDMVVAGTPVELVDSAPPNDTGLTLAPGDVTYSNGVGPGYVFDYTPSGTGPDGTDPNVTAVRIQLTGAMPGATTGVTPSCTIRFSIRVE